MHMADESKIIKEFLGDEAGFKKLDTNGDGFIEPKEAKAAKAPNDAERKGR